MNWIQKFSDHLSPPFAFQSYLIFYHLNNIAYKFLIIYSYEILDNLMFPHIQMSINIDYLFLAPNSMS